jgi:hypothetical protein
MTPATSDSEKVRFHTLNKDTGNRVVSQYVDSVTGKPVKDEHEAKGYERGENDYVLLTDEDLESVELETVRTIDIETFIPRGKEQRRQHHGCFEEVRCSETEIPQSRMIDALASAATSNRMASGGGQRVVRQLASLAWPSA